MGARPYHLLDVFTSSPFGGNQLAVFTDGAGLSGETMQAIARELNLSETVFVLPSRDARASHRLRIFTPGMELPFAGHPTVGTAHLLADLGVVARTGGRASFVFEEEAGLVPITISQRADAPIFVQMSPAQLPQRSDAPITTEDLALLLHLDPHEIGTGSDAPTVWSAGVPFVVVPLATREALRRARLDHGVWSRTLAGSAAPHVYLCHRDAAITHLLHARMFAPAMGIVEDPATGAAACAVAGCLAEGASEPRDRVDAWKISQGLDLGRPSELWVEIDIKANEIRAVRLGGTAVRVGAGTLFV